MIIINNIYCNKQWKKTVFFLIFNTSYELLFIIYEYTSSRYTSRYSTVRVYEYNRKYIDGNIFIINTRVFSRSNDYLFYNFLYNLRSFRKMLNCIIFPSSRFVLTLRFVPNLSPLGLRFVDDDARRAAVRDSPGCLHTAQHTIIKSHGSPYI